MTTETEQVGPLDMARNLVAGIQRAAERIAAVDASPFINHLDGEYGHAAGQLAANLALVSLAEDFHRVTEVLVRADADDRDGREGP